MATLSLGSSLDGSEEVAKAAPWQTVVMVPRSARLRARRALRSQGPGSGRKGEAGQQKVTYLFTEQTASMYVEYSVAKVNRWGKRQERVLGVDREKIYNLLPRLQIDGDDGLGLRARSQRWPVEVGDLRERDPSALGFPCVRTASMRCPRACGVSATDFFNS